MTIFRFHHIKPAEGIKRLENGNAEINYDILCQLFIYKNISKPQGKTKKREYRCSGYRLKQSLVSMLYAVLGLEGRVRDEDHKVSQLSHHWLSLHIHLHHLSQLKSSVTDLGSVHQRSVSWFIFTKPLIVGL